MVGYLFRKPKFPIICKIDNTLLAAKSGADLDSQMQSFGSLADGNYDVIDATGEGWWLNTEHLVVSPLCVKKKWTKREIIQMYNASQCARETQIKYPEKSLSSKKLEKIVVDVAKLISEANKKKSNGGGNPSR